MVEETLGPFAGGGIDRLHLDSVDARHGRAPVQPFDETLERRSLARGKDEHRAVGPVLGPAAEAERGRALGGARAEPDALDTPADDGSPRSCG